MNRTGATVAIVWLAWVAGAAAQVRQAPPSPQPAEATTEVQTSPPDHWGYPVVRIGQDFTLKASDTAREVTVIFGDATIQGRVDRDVVVVLGSARLASTAAIDGSLVVVGGSAQAAEGAQIHQDVFVGGGAFDAPAGFAPGGQYVVIGSAGIGGRLQAIVPWLTHGLLWGRPFVPWLPWVWAVVGVFFLVYLAFTLLFDRPIRACAAAMADKPLTAFLVGLLVLLLAGPVCLLLAVSVIGIAVVPFLLCALFIAALLGRIGVARWIGMSAVRESDEPGRLESLRSFAIGFAIIMLAYMVPVLGLLTWIMVGILGLGAGSLAFIRAYRRENPAPPRPVTPLVVPVVAAAPAVAYQAGTYGEADAPPMDAPGADAVPAAPVMVSSMAAFAHAPFLDRLAAFVLDVILVSIATAMLGDIFETRHGPNPFFVLLLAYHIGFWAWKGTTVGGIICQLRVIRLDGAPLRFVDALVRGLSGIFSLVVVGLGGLWILKDPDRQAWHDKIAGTYVVKVPRNWPI